MPCSPRKARLLLNKGKAKVAKMVPFTLQLLYGSSGYKQEVSLGIDTGTRHIGVSATTEKAVLFEAEVLPRIDIQERLSKGTTCFVFGRRSSGYFDLRTLDGTKVHASASFKKLKSVQKSSSYLMERRGGTPEGVAILPPES